MSKYAECFVSGQLAPDNHRGSFVWESGEARPCRSYVRSPKIIKLLEKYAAELGCRDLDARFSVGERRAHIGTLEVVICDIATKALVGSAKNKRLA